MNNSLAGSGQRQAALVFIFITVLIDVLAFGVIIPVLPRLVKAFSGGSASVASYWVAVFGFVFALIQFVCTPIQGALSDRFGRRPVILLSCLGLGFDFVLMALAPNIGWLLVGRAIAAATSASFSTANAYIADITPPDQRAKSYGMIGAAFGLGFILGPLIGGPAMTWFGIADLRAPFWISATLTLANFIYGLFVLPESLPRHLRSARFDWRHANPFGSLALLRDHPQIWALVAVMFMANLTHYVYPSTFVLYADVRYAWGQAATGYVLAAVGVLTVIVNAFLVGRLVKRMGERRALLFGLSCGVVGFIIYGSAGQGWIFLLGLPISALWALATPASQALVTRQVGPDVQGRIQGAISSLNSFGGILGPALFAGTFGYFIGPKAPFHLPGIPYLIAAALLGVAVFAATRARVSAK